ncbi:T9SS type A sorting domain-containing protein [Crocinitomicaceae bacterium]|nr:T9SS type A sorting domain-containing protein [Crocinitomicaceae bacterium]
MKKFYTLVGAVLLSTSMFAQNDIEASASDNWIAFMNVTDLPADGGAYQFGSPWALADVQTVLDVPNNTITLQPNFNTYADNLTDAFWVNQTTMEGNKQMEASTFVEPGPSFNGQDLTFSGYVLSHTIDADYEGQFFVKALDSLNGYSDALNGNYIQTLPMSGQFTVTVPAAELPTGLLIQYGFTVIGPNANPLEEATLGSIVIGEQDVTGIEELTVEASAYPNPATNELVLSSDAAIESFEIINVAGQVVLTGETNTADVSALNEGSYIVRVNTAKGLATTRFVKK